MKWLYYRFIYRRLMRFAHRFNWHHMRVCYPGNDTMVVCDWCGVRDIIKRGGPTISGGPSQIAKRAAASTRT